MVAQRVRSLVVEWNDDAVYVPAKYLSRTKEQRRVSTPTNERRAPRETNKRSMSHVLLRSLLRELKTLTVEHTDAACRYCLAAHVECLMAAYRCTQRVHAKCRRGCYTGDDDDDAWCDDDDGDDSGGGGVADAVPTACNHRGTGIEGAACVRAVRALAETLDKPTATLLGPEDAVEKVQATPPRAAAKRRSSGAFIVRPLGGGEGWDAYDGDAVDDALGVTDDEDDDVMRRATRRRRRRRAYEQAVAEGVLPRRGR
jgi:hypothetical protein